MTAFPQEGAVAETSASVGITVTRTNSTAALTASVANAPTGVTATVTSPGAGNAGTLLFSAGTATPGIYSLTVDLTDGTSTVSQPLSLAIGATVAVGNAAAGALDEAMSTSFQIAEWTSNFFETYPGNETTPGAATLLGNLGPQHVRMQILSQAIPETAARTWDFTMADASVQPILGVGDHSPEFQIATAPAFMYTSGTPSQGDFTDATYQQFADYAANLVRYYNKGGFTVGTTLYKSASAYPITWWGIYNEPNYNNVTPEEYVTMYNTVVPAMQAVDQSLHFVALELGDAQGVDENYLPTFVANVTAQVDALGTHFYSSCNQMDTDSQLMGTIPTFASWVQYEYSELKTNPALVDVPVWVTENNVNADYASSNGMSMCNPTQKFVTDPRGSSPFFAAWRTYEFSALGKAGVHALYDWSFDGDAQYGEFNSSTGQLQLSYWVDYWLSRMFPSTQGATIYSVKGTDESDVEVLAVKEPSGATVVMVSNHGAANANDDNGAGVPRTVLVDVSSLGTFTTAQEVVIDKNTSAATGPTEQAMAVAPQMQVTLDGYGVAFLVLH
ncbi:MAG: hypothetical protein WAM66_05695 [Acidobacteriaceae bacterium]